jgi:tryptophan-rich sensory protein
LQRNSQGKKERSGGEHVFNPDPLLFPATWLPLRWLQIFAVAKAFSTDPLQHRWCSPEDSNIVIPRQMKQYLVQLALGDEWHRVFLGERRIGLGTLVVLSYFISLLLMVFTTFTLDGGAAAMLIPSVFAAIISGLMNIMIFWNWVPKSSI